MDREGRADVGPTPPRADQSRRPGQICGRTALIAAGEREAFHGSPAAGAELLEAALAADPGSMRARWLLGVCLGALGRYSAAAAVLEPVLDTDPLAATARASHLRQLERHAEAERLDLAALRLAQHHTPPADPPAGLATAPLAGHAGETPAATHAEPQPWGAAGSDALADALTGLVADAVGRHDLAVAQARLATATAHAATTHAAMAHTAMARTTHTDAAGGWRARVRLAWVGAEVALMADRPAEAARQAADALRLARAAGAPRHVTKSLLFRGVAEHVLGDPAAAGTLDAAARAAQDLGLLPLLWPARLVRSRVLAATDPEAARADLTVADATMRAIAGGLPVRPSSAHLTQSGRI